MEGWSQRPHSPEGDSPLTRSLRSLQGHSTNIPGEQLHPISFPSGLHLPIPLITLLFAILLSYPSCPILSVTLQHLLPILLTPFSLFLIIPLEWLGLEGNLHVHPLTPTPLLSHPFSFLSSRLQSPLGRRPRAHRRPLATERGGGLPPTITRIWGAAHQPPPPPGGCEQCQPHPGGGSPWKEGARDPWAPPPCMAAPAWLPAPLAVSAGSSLYKCTLFCSSPCCGPPLPADYKYVRMCTRRVNNPPPPPRPPPVSPPQGTAVSPGLGRRAASAHPTCRGGAGAGVSDIYIIYNRAKTDWLLFDAVPSGLFSSLPR